MFDLVVIDYFTVFMHQKSIYIQWAHVYKYWLYTNNSIWHGHKTNDLCIYMYFYSVLPLLLHIFIFEDLHTLALIIVT